MRNRHLTSWGVKGLIRPLCYLKSPVTWHTWGWGKESRQGGGGGLILFVPQRAAQPTRRWEKKRTLVVCSPLAQPSVHTVPDTCTSPSELGFPVMGSTAGLVCRETLLVGGKVTAQQSEGWEGAGWIWGHFLKIDLKAGSFIPTNTYIVFFR